MSIGKAIFSSIHIGRQGADKFARSRVLSTIAQQIADVSQADFAMLVQPLQLLSG